MTKKNGKRSFLLLNEKNEIVAKFENKFPRQAALKAANKGITDIRLLERGTKNKIKGGWKIHKFLGTRELVQKPYILCSLCT